MNLSLGIGQLPLVRRYEQYKLRNTKKLVQTHRVRVLRECQCIIFKRDGAIRAWPVVAMSFVYWFGTVAVRVTHGDHFEVLSRAHTSVKLFAFALDLWRLNSSEITRGGG